MSSFGDNIRWLITWARSYPRDADHLVARLKAKQEDFKRGGGDLTRP